MNLSSCSTVCRYSHRHGQFEDPVRQILRQILRRILYALIVLTAVAMLVMVDRKGYKDGSDGDADLPDALYYATVTLSTTGYGDIVPVSDLARFTNIVVIRRCASPSWQSWPAPPSRYSLEVTGISCAKTVGGKPCTDTLSSSATAPRDTTRSSS